MTIRFDQQYTHAVMRKDCSQRAATDPGAENGDVEAMIAGALGALRHVFHRAGLSTGHAIPHYSTTLTAWSSVGNRQDQKQTIFPSPNTR